jgi:hypothetical protein
MNLYGKEKEEGQESNGKKIFETGRGIKLVPVATRSEE